MSLVYQDVFHKSEERKWRHRLVYLSTSGEGETGCAAPSQDPILHLLD